MTVVSLWLPATVRADEVSPPPSVAPPAAYSNAVKLQAAAAALAKKGDIKSAYQASVIAWQSIRKEKNHKATQELAAKLYKDMEKYGEQLETPRIRNVLSKPVRYE